jgi:hypothetical protein
MVNLPPDSNQPRQRREGSSSSGSYIRDLDELLAVVLAFLGIGAILWWGLARDRSFLAETPLVRPLTTAEAPRTAVDPRPDRGIFQPRALEDDRAVRVRPPITGEAGLPQFGPPVPSSRAIAPTGPVIAPLPVTPETPEAVPQTTQPLDISDVPPDHWAYPFIKPMFDQGYLPDLPSGQFQPDQVLTRAELAALLNRAFDLPSERQPLGFSDVPDTYWAASAIDQMVAQGVMSGYPDNRFQPDRSVPRYEVLVALVTGLNLPPSTTADETLQAFVDADGLPAWSRAQVAAAAENALIVNHPSRDRLQPNQAATRAEIVALLHQALVSQGRLPAVNSPYVVPAL